MIEIIIKSILIGWMITRFEPLQMILELIPDVKSPLVNIISNIVKLLLTCSKCTTFWLSLLIFQDVYLAIASSFFMVIYEKTIGKWERQVRF